MGWLVFSNLYVAFCGAALTAASYPLIGVAPRVDAVVALVFFGTLIIYNLDRLVEPQPGQSPHERWVQAHRRPLWAMVVLACAGSLACLPYLSSTGVTALGVAAAVSVGYCVPVYRSGGRWRRLKALPGAKLLLIAGVWTFATLSLPLIEVGTHLSGVSLAALFGSRMLFLLAVAMPFDLPDAERDRKAGIVTLPQRLGVDGTRRWSSGLAVGAGALGIACPWPMAAALILSACFTFAMARALKHDRGVVYYEVGLDGMLLIQATLIVCLWVATPGAV